MTQSLYHQNSLSKIFVDSYSLTNKIFQHNSNLVTLVLLKRANLQLFNTSMFGLLATLLKSMGFFLANNVVSMSRLTKFSPLFFFGICTTMFPKNRTQLIYKEKKQALPLFYGF